MRKGVACDLRREAPIDRRVFGVVPDLPSINSMGQDCGIRGTLSEHLSRQDREFDFSHAVSHRRATVARHERCSTMHGPCGPLTAMFGRKVKRKLAGDTQRLGWCKGLCNAPLKLGFYRRFGEARLFANIRLKLLDQEPYFALSQVAL